MKRSTTPSPNHSEKRAKIHVSPLHEIEEQPPTDIIQHGVDESKCISGKFKMTWPSTDKKEVIVSIPSLEPKEIVFRIVFYLQDIYLTILDFSPLDQFRLSLKGAHLRRLPRIPGSCNVPIELTYMEGVHIEWQNRGPNPETRSVNTWLASEPRKKTGDAWYSSPEEDFFSTHSNIAENLSSKEPKPRKEAVNDKPGVLAENQAKQSKKELRKQAKRQKRGAATRQASKPLLDTDNTDTSTSSKNSLISSKEKSRAQESGYLPKVTIAASSGNGVSSADSQQRCSFTALQSNHHVDLSGIVIDMSEPCQTRTGDWMRHLQIVEPNTYGKHNTSFSNGFKVNCFTKRYKEWLPQVNSGDVVMLRNVKVVEYQGGLTGTCYSDKLQWVGYSPSRGEIHHGPNSDKVPKAEATGGGFGPLLSPFFQPDDKDIQHLIWLSDWWRKTDMVVNRYVANTTRPQRVHRLICDAGPQVPPAGYFDCTIQVLKIYTDNDRHVHTLYATDYTRNDQMQGSSSKDWQAGLNEYVMRFSMFDDAATFAERNMQPGQFYLIKNARMKTDPNSLLEAKVVQDKIFLLEERHAATNVHLKALLERKKAWELCHPETGSNIDHALFEDVKEGKYFHCTAELLYASPKSSGVPYIFITDYTENIRLSTKQVNAPWLQGFKNRIIKIILSEAQTNIAESPSIGSVYAFRKLKLKYSQIENQFCGFLGGTEKLISKLNPDTISSEHLNGFLRRKEAWNRVNHPGSHEKDQNESMQTRLDIYARIRDMHFDNHGGRHVVKGKVIDFYPLDLRDAFYQFCSKCTKDIPSFQKACSKCNDFDHEFLQYRFQFFIMVEDECGDQIKISIHDKCSIFDGLRRGHLREDHQAFSAFQNRVQPLVGKLVPIHDCISTGKQCSKADTPMLHFELDSWTISNGTTAFGLYQYENR